MGLLVFFHNKQDNSCLNLVYMLKLMETISFFWGGGWLNLMAFVRFDQQIYEEYNEIFIPMCGGYSFLPGFVFHHSILAWS